MAVRIKGTDLVYFPVPKVACTSIKEAILRHNNPVAFAALTEPDEVHRRYGTHRWLREQWRLLKPFMRPFCIVRDPIDRFVSGYRNRILHHNDLADETPDINSFALALAKHCATDSHIGHHFTPMVNFIGHNPDFFDRVFRWSELGEITNYAGLSPLERRQAGGPPMSRTDLSPEASAYLHDFYAVDYEVWGSHF